MKSRSFLFLFLIIFSFGCKRNNDDSVDPRDQYIGNYNVAYTSSTLIGTFVLVDKETGNGTITVTKGDAANELKFRIVFGTVAEDVVARTDGAKFTLLKQKEVIRIQNNTYNADYAGSGEFKGVNMSINAVTQATSPDGTKLVKSMVYNGVKK